MTDLLARAERLLTWLPDWAVSLVLFALVIVAALFASSSIHRLLTRMAANRDLFWRSLVKRLELPLRLGLVIAGSWLVAFVAPLSYGEANIVRHALSIGFIVLAVLAARTAMHIWLTLYLRRFKLDSEDNLLARKHVTQSRILERVATTLLVIVGAATILMTFDGVAQYGVSLLASAGAAGLVLGLALQPLLKNIFAGIQLAITQPIRIDDALLLEGEWGTVEEITSTYVVIKIWDWRRMIVPLSYFMEKPFQNWTREGASLIGSVTMYLDYSVPIDVIRSKLNDIVRASPLWDKNIAHVQVTDLRETNLEVRILVTARDAAPRLRSALRGPRKAHRLPPGRLPPHPPPHPHAGRPRRPAPRRPNGPRRRHALTSSRAGWRPAPGEGLAHPPASSSGLTRGPSKERKSLQWSDQRQEGHESYARMAAAAHPRANARAATHPPAVIPANAGTHGSAAATPLARPRPSPPRAAPQPAPRPQCHSRAGGNPPRRLPYCA